MGSKREVVVTATGSGHFMLAVAATPWDYQCWGRVMWQLKMGREVAARLSHGQYYGEKDSGSCLGNFFASTGGSRRGILSVIFIFLRFVSLMSRKFKLVCGWKQELMKINMKQTEHPTCLWLDPVQHTLLEPARRSDTAQTCSPIPLPEQSHLALTRTGFLLGTGITSLFCAAPFSPQSLRGAENLSHWAANKRQWLLNTQRLFQGKF